MGPLRFGVIGVGRGWPRWASAFAAGGAAVVAVHDPRLARAARAAEPLGAAVCGGVVELLERDDVDAVLLGPAWFRSWPLPHAAAHGKPVLCAASLDGDAPGAVWPADWPLLWRGGRALREVVEGLGPVRFVQTTAARGGDELLTLCADLFGAEPLAARGVRVEGVAAWLVEFGGGRAAQLTTRPGATAVVAVEAERGGARLELPGRLEWHNAAGRHTRQLPARAAEAEVLRAFVAAVRAGGPMDEWPRRRRAGALLT